MTSSDPLLRQLRHDLRGRANTLILCAAALPYAESKDERLNFTDEIIRATDNLLSVLDKLEAMPEHFESVDNSST